MHDRNGTLLKKGDVVIIPCVVEGLSEGTEDFCNINLQTLHGRKPDRQKERFSVINTAQVILYERPDSK
jgi:hypothetical protein